MRLLLSLLLLFVFSYGDTKKVYFYTTETNINNFKVLKVSFDNYLDEYGEYEFQPFNDRETFEKNLKEKDSIIILSSWHYQKIAKEFNLKAKLVADKKGSITDTKILVGQKNIPLRGVLTSAYDKSYTKELLSKLINSKNAKLSTLVVPKEIDALMSVGFGMSKFALVSKDSFLLLQEINLELSKKLTVYYESTPKYRMVLANQRIDSKKNEIIEIFQTMDKKKKGKNILNRIGIDKFVSMEESDLIQLEGIK